jgi:CubicO group peptidase (beta-lactamase class C family)
MPTMGRDDAFAVAEAGVIVAERDAGVVVPWWSFTKSVIAAAALTLVRDGKLNLDAPMGSKPFTLRQLLQHRAGIGEYGALREYHRAVADRAEPWPVAELLSRVDADRLRFAPGTGWLYSNVGYLLVRRHIEETVGATLNSVLRERVLEPLGISETFIAETPADLVGVMMCGAVGYHPGWVYHGLLVGPLREAPVLLDRLLAGALLPSELLGQMLDGQRLNMSIPERPWQETAYGLGLMCGKAPIDGFVAGHSGGGPGSVISVYRLYDRQPIRTGAAFLPGDDAGAVERAAILQAAGQARAQGPSPVAQ